MTCTSCGDKPKGSSKGFPRAVVEINNPESLVLLRKVVIPASMGTEEDVPPAIGKYFNVLLQYESNGHIYLYSSDGIPTAIEANIPQEVLDKIDQLEIDVDLLETGLANETEAREAADSALSSSINSLSSSLSAETAAREQADTTLQNNITAEATARANADTNLQNQITQEAQARAAADTTINGAITAEAATRQTADAGLQSQIDAITASSDVKDIVGTKAELNNYDTSTLGNNDIIKVLQDESENDATTYYRWNATTQQFTLIGEEGPYYTKSQADTLLNAKQNTLTAGSNVQIVNDTISATDTTYTAGTGLALNGTQFSVDTTAIATQSDLTAGLATKQDTLTAGANVQINNNTISATDTTYSAFTGTDGQTAGTSGLVPAPTTTDAGKFLKADGTWDTVGSSVNVVQATGTSTTDVMSQNAVSRLIYGTTGTSISNEKLRVGVGGGNNQQQNGSAEFGHGAFTNKSGQIAFPYTDLSSEAAGVFGVGAYNASFGYNNSNYRLLTGLYDPQSAHDAATKGYVDNSLLGKQDALTAGSGITIEDESGSLVISATGGSGGGGVIELTSADYNYDYGSTGTNNCIALWLLSEGTYSWATTLRSSVRVTTTVTAGDLSADGALVIAASDANLAKVYLYGDGSATTVTGRNILQMYRVNKTNGTSNVSGAAITTRELKQSTGNSESDIMSQKATTWMVYNGGNSTKVQIGANSGAPQNWSVAILGATSQENTIAIGNAASATAKGAIALGIGSNASTQGVFDVGLSNTSSSIQSTNGYNGSAYRLLTGLYDPQSAHDAATKGYVDTAVAGAGASAFTTNEWNALWA